MWSWLNNTTSHYQQSVNSMILCLITTHFPVSRLSLSPGFHCFCRCQTRGPSLLQQTSCEAEKHCSCPLQASDISKVFLLSVTPFIIRETLWVMTHWALYESPTAFSENPFNCQQGNGGSVGLFSLFCSYSLDLTTNSNASPEFNSIIKIYSSHLPKVT